MPPRRPQYWAISTRDDELAAATFCGHLEAEVVQQAQRACEPWPPGPRGDRAREILRDSCDDTTGGLCPAVGFQPREDLVQDHVVMTGKEFGTRVRSEERRVGKE